VRVDRCPRGRGPRRHRFGYPELTPEIKAKVLGLNAAALLGLDPNDRWCGVDAARFEEAKATYAGMHVFGPTALTAVSGPRPSRRRRPLASRRRTPC